MVLQVLIGVAASMLVAWIVLLVSLMRHRPDRSRAQEALRLLPDTVRLLRRVGADRTLGRGIRVRLWLLLAYLAFPIDLVPDFLPLVGYADDAIIVGVVLRSVIRRAGPDALRRHWPGTDAGLVALWDAAGLPGTAPSGPDRARPPT
jgi:uncharacterized membrane protein YkvA (DUF1232 family)